MRTIKIFIKDTLGTSQALKEQLEQIPFESTEYRLNYVAIEDASLPLERISYQEIGDGISLYYQFEDQIDEENDPRTLMQFAHAHEVLIRRQLEQSEQFKSRLRSSIQETLHHLKQEARPLVRTIREEVKPAVRDVWSNVTSYFSSNKQQPTLFNAPERKRYYDRIAKSELIVGVVGGLLSVGIGFLSPLAAGIIAFAALLLIGAAIYHKTKAKDFDHESRFEQLSTLQ